MAKTAAVKASKKPLKKRIWDQRYLFLLMVPAIIWVAVICYAPMTGLYMAFTNYAPSTKGYFHDLLSAPFVGGEWFQYDHEKYHGDQSFDSFVFFSGANHHCYPFK